MSTSTEVVSLLYKAFLRTSRSLSKEVARLRSADVFSESEIKWIQKYVPAALKAVGHGEQALKDVVRHEFRVKRPDQDVDRRLDMGFSALSMFNNRLSLLLDLAEEPASDNLTRGVRVKVSSEPHAETSLGHFFIYKVKIKNESVPEPVQLISREWRIRDLDGHVQEVVGPGVVGVQPILEMGMEHVYSSSVTLKSRRGTMSGSYQMIAHDSQEVFDVQVGPFALIAE